MDLPRAADFQRVVFFTGAGLSKESGVPTYRIVGEAAASVGQSVRIVGRTSGERSGNVTNTCISTESVFLARTMPP